MFFFFHHFLVNSFFFFLFFLLLLLIIMTISLFTLPQWRRFTRNSTNPASTIFKRIDWCLCVTLFFFITICCRFQVQISVNNEIRKLGYLDPRILCIIKLNPMFTLNLDIARRIHTESITELQLIANKMLRQDLIIERDITDFYPLQRRYIYCTTPPWRICIMSVIQPREHKNHGFAIYSIDVVRVVHHNRLTINKDLCHIIDA
mmetsp:Transcript_45227/g.75004  ORF Transcript_45227/g.75004 Transcript_45227/m.75004 type:complete len:204 (-) Transcript_45227:2804-3415(-)